MATVHERLSQRFYNWEQRGRGWQVFPQSVYPEPPFTPFQNHQLPEAPVIDDGRRPTFLSSLWKKVAAPPSTPPVVPQDEEEPEPTPLERDTLVELHTSLPADLDLSQESFEQFLLNLSLCREPIAFEMIGAPGKINVQFVASEPDAPLVRRQLQAYFSEASFVPQENVLDDLWHTCSGEEALVVEFGLGREFMFSLASGKLDPFVGVVGALSELQPDEMGVFQVLWQPLRHPWAENIVRLVTHEDGKPFFLNAPELAKAAESKVSKPLYAAVVRVAGKAETFDRALQIVGDVAGSLRVFANPAGNELIPLRNDLAEYPNKDHLEDLLHRQSRRCGMILNSDELIGLVHLPSSAVRSPVLERDSGKTKSAPAIVQHERGLLLGKNIHLDKDIDVSITPEQRTRHVHVIGASGTGKSTLLLNLIKQDVDSGQGVAVLDPHGDLVDKILGVIPPERIQDVILVDPSDEEYSIGFNILSAHGDHEKTLLASDLVSVFQRLSTSWGDQMQSVLQNAILAFLNSSRGGTLADLRRFLVEPLFRNEFLKSVSDPNVLYYWHKGFPHLSGNKSIGPILTRLEMFLAQRPIAHMVSQPENRLNFGDIMDTGKIFLAKLPEGLLGRENSYLLGALLVSKFQQLVMARQAKKIAARRDFWIYIDEFANFITPTMAEILSGARKYRIGLTLAHHELHQLQRNSEVASAVMTHPYTRVVFRVGDEDAKKLAEGFSLFEPADLKNLETGQAVCRVERSDFDFNLSVLWPEMPDEAALVERQVAVVAASRQQYGTPRAQVEAMLRQAWEVGAGAPPPTSAPTPAKSKPAQTASPPSNQPIAAPLPTQATVSESPKISEVPNSGIPSGLPKDTVSEKKSAEPPVERPIAPVAKSEPPIIEPLAVAKPKPTAEPGPPKDLGRGSLDHQSLQKQLQEEARSLGFRADIEKQLKSSSLQAADLLLERDGLIIAVEMAFTTGPGHEFENVQKCLAAGFPKVIVISQDLEKLAKIREFVLPKLAPEQVAKVIFCGPGEFTPELRKIIVQTGPPPPSIPGKSKILGYTVTHSKPQMSPEEEQEKQDLAHGMIAEIMRRRKGKKGS